MSEVNFQINRRGVCFGRLFVLIFMFFIFNKNLSLAQTKTGLSTIIPQTEKSIKDSKPWVFWYWMQAAVSKEGITADLEAMKKAGIGGAYLMPIKGATNPPVFTPVVEQLSPLWWEMVKHAMSEAARLNLEMGMHVSDGFALAGGPWITPALSMQKVVSSKLNVKGNQHIDIQLPQPEKNENYYQDIAVYAFPSLTGTGQSTRTIVPVVTSSKADVNPQFLVKEGNKEGFKSDEPCWIQYAFEKPFTCRTVVVKTGGNNYQAQRLLIEVSDDGKTFRSIGRLTSPRHGWQDTDADITHAITPTTAKYFRFVYDKTGTEPGAEDLDAAKWKPSFKTIGIELSAEPVIHQFEGKAAEVWRISKASTAEQLADSICVPQQKIINVSDKVRADGRLVWDVPAGSWTILRIGHTSTGHTNATGGAGKGLECDKFNPEAIKLQFDKWFGEAQRQLGSELSKNALKVFHVDSWECGSQNWSPVFREEFKQRRGYDLLPYLPIVAGIPVENAAFSEKFLYDFRQTVSELVVDTFYKMLADLAKEKGVKFTAESVAPTMTSDGLAHYKLVDVPMGEFWLNSPTHDKPNDMLDAISAGHIYGKPIIQAEAFTTLRMTWNEHPATLKTLQDRNYALGINKLVYHVFMHNPWLDRKPGMTLDGVGLYFQRDQTWWKAGKAWVDYAQRCQSLLQKGFPVTDLAVFIGDEIPRRSVLPDRLVPTLTGLFGKEVVAQEAERLKNAGQPLRQIPISVTHSANMADPENWVNALRGYAYDSFNPDALLNTAKVKNGKVIFGDGTSYSALILPKKHAMTPNANTMSAQTAEKLLALVSEGATLIIGDKPEIEAGTKSSKALENFARQCWEGNFDIMMDGADKIFYKNVGKGKVVKSPFEANTLAKLGIEQDVIVKDEQGNYAKGIAWTHRKASDLELYFLANQENTERLLDFSLRANGKSIQLYDAVSDKIFSPKSWKVENGRTNLTLKLEGNASVFVIFKDSFDNFSKVVKAKVKADKAKNWQEFKAFQSLDIAWEVDFENSKTNQKITKTFEKLNDWTVNSDSLIRYYAGTANYRQSFEVRTLPKKNQEIWLDLGKVANLAEVKVNGIACGIVWTAPYQVDISKALKIGKNELSIEVTNTWANRLIGDILLPEKQRTTNTTAPMKYLDTKTLYESGLIGPVKLLQSEGNR